MTKAATPHSEMAAAAKPSFARLLTNGWELPPAPPARR
ncbi:hypothetical protein DA2_1818 [Desulfovibrio sp. A2]|nr:hypothetical protein DA2_1818 [Desulfovibrio sp. A2]